MTRTLYIEFATPQNVAPKLTICNLKVLVAELVIPREEDLLLHLTVLNPTEKL